MSYNLTGSAYGGNLSLSKAGLAAGTTTNFTTANALTYAIRGQLYSLAAGSNQTTPVVDGATGLAFKQLVANQACIFAFFVNAAGAVAVNQGPIISNLDLTGGSGAAQFPQDLDGEGAPFGYVLAQAGPTLAAPWVFGVGNLAAGVTGLSLTFRDVMSFPAQPITG